tara:strand:+ start:1593 stop:2312 length:720 start_codon:yes stop_codon:yes gene_type:complete
MADKKINKCVQCGEDNQDLLEYGYKEEDYKCYSCIEINFKNNYEMINEVHNSEETGLIVENYPYGFKRTKIKYWIETTKRGDRFVSQTLNPKTQLWNKPKKSTYKGVEVLIKQKSNGYIKIRAWSYNDGIEKQNKFKEFIGDFPLNELQIDLLKKGLAYEKVMKNVSFEIKARKFKNLETGEISESVDIFDLKNVVEVDDNGVEVDIVKEKEKQKETESNINKSMAYEYSKLKSEEFKK